MLDGAAEIVRLAYHVWPSYGGAFVLVSVLVGLLFAPLTIRSAHSAQKLAVLRPEIQRIQTAHAGNSAARNAAIMALYRSHGVALGPGCLLSILRIAVLVVLFMLVRGLVTLDPGNGGGPRYVEQGTALWQSLKNSNGQLPWLGVDLGKTLVTQGAAIGVFVYLILLTVLVVVTVESMHVATDLPARQGVGVLIVTFVVALVLPGAVVLHLVMDALFSKGVVALTTEQGRLRQWWKRPHKEFQARSREANRLDAAGSWDAAATLRLSTITEFGRKASADQLVEYAHDIRHNLVIAAARWPSAAIVALAELDRECPQCVSRDMVSSVVREWARSPRLDRFENDWVKIKKVLAGKNQNLLGMLLDACWGMSRDELTGTFRHGVTTYLWNHLDRNLHLAPPIGRQALDDHRYAFQLLDLVRPWDLPWADQLCALGDVALARASPSEALGRYEVAGQHGSTQAAERLAYHQAREGHRLLSVGKITAAQRKFAEARRKFAEARRQHKDQEYELLDAIADLLSDDTDTRRVLDKLKSLDGAGAPVPDVAFWLAIAHLRQGEQGQTIALLRSLSRHHGDGNKPWGPLEEGAVLLAVLENDDHVLVDWARRLARVYGERWLEAGPTDPWPMVGMVARHDRALLAEMVALVGDPDELPGWVRVAGAHALLMKSMEFTRKGLAGEAAGDAELAERLLRG